ncbi:hypothetical protein F66182_8656 [Fusarium sp. NRRL 66182]|nr:hypothetical protein F66182_8656 [Fusarium sp. NRRL 66182]
MIATYTLIGLILALAQFVPVHSFDLEDRDDTLKASKSLASSLISFYHGNESGQTPGLLPEVTIDDNEAGEASGYYWLQSGAFMSAYIDYWHLTGDDTYNDLVAQGIQWQVGENHDFMPANRTATIANDEQSIWALGALTAAEYDFPASSGEQPRWLDLAIAVWETQRERWDLEVENGSCDGGLRWGIVPTFDGYDYISGFSNSLFFNLGARLARFTGNETFAGYAENTWDWLEANELLDTASWVVYDGRYANMNCTENSKALMSASPASLIMGAAFMYNLTDGAREWKDRTEQLTAATVKLFFPKNKGFVEVACIQDYCGRDQLTYKAFAHRWLAVTTQVAPFTSDLILPALQRSAEMSKERNKVDDDALEQTLGNFAAVSNLLIAGSASPRTQNLTTEDGVNKTEDGAISSSSSSSSPASTEEADEENCSARFVDVASLMATYLLMFLSLWIH